MVPRTPTRRRQPSKLAAVALAGALSGCEPDEGPAQTFELDGLTVDAYFTDPVCGGTLRYFDRRLRWLEHETGLSTTGHPLRYAWYREAVPAKSCGSDAEGCADGSVMFAPLLLFSHELVHGLLSQLGTVRPWLAEGMARLLEDDFTEPPLEPTDPSSLVMSNVPAELDYNSAGTFVAYLAKRHGLARLLDFYQAADGADVDETREVFAEVFGESLDSVEDDYLATYDDATPFGGVVCDAPSVAWASSLRWEYRFTDGCEGERSIGPFDLPPAGTEPDPWFEDSVTLRVETPGFFRVDTTGISSATIVVRSCTSPGAVVLWSDEPVSGYQWFDRGQVRVTLRASLDVVPDVQVRLTRYPDMIAER